MNAIATNRRILLIDDNPAIHEDFRKILLENMAADAGYEDAKALVFGGGPARTRRVQFELESAFQGQQGLDLVNAAAAQSRPFAMAFVDVRMPPGWDGIETIVRIWEKHPDLQIVICTAYSDYSWDDMQLRLGESDNLLILKKPFDNVEVLQLAHALTAKWNVTRAANLQIQELDRAVELRTQELRKSEERFAKAFFCNPHAMFIQTIADDRIIDANPAFLRLIGLEAALVLGQSTTRLKMWEEPGVQTTTDALAKTMDSRESKILIRTARNENRLVILFGEEFASSVEPCRLVLLHDITDRVKLEADLRQAHKMEAVGQLAAGVAHDFNNILTIVQGHLSLVLTRNGFDPKTHTALSQALSASERAGALTRQLLAFSRKQAMEPKPLRLSSLFEQVEAMVQRVIGENIDVEFSCPHDLPRVMADRCNMEQVLINLAVNARDAMPNGGKLTIEVAERAPDKLPAELVNEAGANRFVCIQVSDTGVGMDERTKARIFEPFFTTKEPGRGTGMGLATVYGIVKQHHGWIDVTSTFGQGTTFSIYLPTCEQTEETTFLCKSEVIDFNGSETILVVEDEDFLLEFVQEVLTSHGYCVLAAKTAVEALEIWRSKGTEISLLLTDMVMPGGMTGRQLGEKLRQQSAGLQVIYSSGYSLELVGNNTFETGVVLLQKPYHASDLARTVRETLNRNSRPCANPKTVALPS